MGKLRRTGEDSIAEFGNELQNINSRVSEILNRRPRLEASLMLEEIHQFVRSNFVFDEDKETALASCMLNYINLPYDLKLSLLFYCAFLGRPFRGQLRCLETVLYNAKRVRVLGLEKTQLKSLPDVVGKLVNLRHLSVRQSKINELPESISNLRNLQTLDISWSGNEFELSNGVLNLAQQRHLKMFRPRNAGEVRVPRGISRLRNLQTLEGIYAGGGIAKELGNMTQLRSLEVRSVSEDHAEIEEGALPSLKQLCFFNCTKLMVLPEGLQHATTLQILDLWNVHEDLIRRLRSNGASFQWKLNSTLAQDIEILLDVKDQIVSIISKLDEVGRSICEADCYVDDFIAQVYGRNQQDQKEMIAKFGSELENINSGIMNIMHERCFSDDYASDLYASIMKMTGLSPSPLGWRIRSNFKSLFWFADSLFPSESFSPPSLQTLKLEGRLIESPAWLGSMENLTKLPMDSSHLSEN
ncbi:putative disease resistance RPP13-like protein 2 [Vitis vinifera]|uniref:Putative disease resistance RPP13-like protein 2 n=1 Tax=Vitis vinifera TaxID=29760 RepID=A0A438HTK1_VITVI|nr:putative disease resistance RPP13-like protein 2 [Vitis vinifera]